MALEWAVTGRTAARAVPHWRVIMSSSHRRRVPVVSAAVLGSLLAALALTASAQMFKQSRSNLDQLTFSKRELRVTQTLADADAIKGLITNQDAMTQFRSQYGAAWRFLIDERTGRLNLLEGGAIPFIPGAANKLQLEGVTGECRTASCVPAAKI